MNFCVSHKCNVYRGRKTKKVNLIVGEKRYGLREISDEEIIEVGEKGKSKLISIYKNVELSNSKLMLNGNAINLYKNIPQLKIICCKQQTNRFVRNAISPEPKDRVYLWLNPKECSMSRLMEDLQERNPIKSPSIQQPLFLKNCEDPDTMIRLMSMYTQKRLVSHLPDIKTSPSPSNFISPDSSFFSEFIWECRLYTKQEHENRKRILNSLITETEIEFIKDCIQTSLRKKL